MGPVISRPIGFLEKPQLVKVDTSAFGKFNELNLCLWLAFLQGSNADSIIFDYLFMCSLRLKNLNLNKVIFCISLKSVM